MTAGLTTSGSSQDTRSAQRPVRNSIHTGPMFSMQVPQDSAEVGSGYASLKRTKRTKGAARGSPHLHPQPSPPFRPATTVETKLTQRLAINYIAVKCRRAIVSAGFSLEGSLRQDAK